MSWTEAELAAAAAARVGSVLGGKYRLVRVLGIGGMGAVYAAVHRNGARVAVKVLHPPYSRSDEMRRRFVREGLLANRIEHPGVVRILDDDRAEDGTAYLVMELLTGTTCRELAGRHHGRLALGSTLVVAHEVLRALAAAHREHVIHRDVKPSNVFITARGEVKLLDFGIARLRETGAPLDVRTDTGAVLGTPGFMCPEQALGRTSEVDARSDLWGVGAMMFNLLTGEPVHVGETAQEVSVYTATRPVRPLASVTEVPAAVAAIVDRALALAPADRWQSASEMADAVARAHAALAPTASGAPEIEAVADWTAELDLTQAESEPPVGVVTLDPISAAEATEPAGGGAAPELGLHDGLDPTLASLEQRPAASTVALGMPAPSPAGAPAARRRLGGGPVALVIAACSLGVLAVASWWIGRGTAPAPPASAPVREPAAAATCSGSACAITSSCQGGRCCAPAVTTGAPATNTTSIVDWELAAPAAELVATVTIEAGPSSSVATGLAPLRGTIDGQQFTYQLQTDVYNRRGSFGRGVLFVRGTVGDVSEVRPTGMGVAQGPWTDQPDGDQVSMRQGYDWQPGTYHLRLRRGEAGLHPERGVPGDWFEISIDDPQRGEESALGSVWFARANPEVPASIAPAIRSFHLFYPRFSEVQKHKDQRDFEWAPAYATLPLWTVSTMVRGDGVPARRATSIYQFKAPVEFATSDVWYDAVADRVVTAAGGATARCHPAQQLFAH